MEQAIGSGIQVNFSEYLSQFEPNEFTIEKTVKWSRRCKFTFRSISFRSNFATEDRSRWTLIVENNLQNIHTSTIQCFAALIRRFAIRKNASNFDREYSSLVRYIFVQSHTCAQCINLSIGQTSNVADENALSMRKFRIQKLVKVR